MPALTGTDRISGEGEGPLLADCRPSTGVNEIGGDTDPVAVFPGVRDEYAMLGHLVNHLWLGAA